MEPYQNAMATNIADLTQVGSALPNADAAFEWPRQAMREKNWPVACERWEILRCAYPNHPAAWFQGVEAYIEGGNLDQAEELLTEARQRFPRHPNSLLMPAIIAMRSRDWAKADNFLKQAREAHPAELQVWLQSAALAEELGNTDLADKCYETARECAPQKPGPLIQQAEFAMRCDRLERALDLWREVRERFPKVPTGYTRAADAARQLGRTKEARQLLLTQQYGAEIFARAAAGSGTAQPRSAHVGLAQLMSLIWTKAIFGLRSEVHRNYLSYGWWVLEPLLHMAIYYVVFGFLLQRGGQSYPIFLLTGLIPWMWFMKAVNSSSTSILGGQNLMLQVGLPSVVFPLVTTVQTTLKQTPVFLLLFAFVWLGGHPPNIHWWALFPLIVVQAVLTIAIGCALAAVIPFARDLAYLVPTGLTFLMFLSGIFYDYHRISPGWQKLFLLNPVAFLIKCYREILLGNQAPNLFRLAEFGAAGFASCVLLLLIYQRLRYIFPRIVME